MLMRLMSALPKAALFALPLSPMMMAHGGSGTWEKRGAFALNIAAFVLLAMFSIALWLPLLGLAAWGGAFWCGVLSIERAKREKALDKEWKRWEKLARNEKWKGRARGAISAPVGLASRAIRKLPPIWSRKGNNSGPTDQSSG